MILVEQLEYGMLISVVSLHFFFQIPYCFLVKPGFLPYETNAGESKEECTFLTPRVPFPCSSGCECGRGCLLSGFGYSYGLFPWIKFGKLS